jgi:hypothetical protein
MPLPVRIGYLSEDGTEKTVSVKSSEKPSGYTPTVDYHPTHVVVKCRECKGVGIAEFVNGFNFKDGDKLMAGRPIRGICFRCKKETELVPLTKLSPEKDGEIKHLYNIQQALDEATKRGEPIDPNAVIWPLARIRAYEKWRETQRG